MKFGERESSGTRDKGRKQRARTFEHD
ncbi:unnamed protein product [Ectocarpus sp. CCAP 1310/34]|nr:unnamed protein product [Ectocarpus sp. CCAP 1310/34]